MQIEISFNLQSKCIWKDTWNLKGNVENYHEEVSSNIENGTGYYVNMYCDAQFIHHNEGLIQSGVDFGSRGIITKKNK